MSKERQLEMVKAINRTLTTEVQEYLIFQSLTQVELAAWYGRTPSNMNRLLRDQRDLKLSDVVAMAYFMGKAVTLTLEDLDPPPEEWEYEEGYPYDE